MAVQAEVRRRRPARIASDLVVVRIHARACVLAVVATDAVRVVSIHGRAELWVVARHAVVSVPRMRTGLNREGILGVRTPHRGRPGSGRMTVLAGGRKVRVSRVRAAVVVALMTTDAERRRPLVHRRIAEMARSALERRMRPVQWPGVHEGRRRPGIAVVAAATGVRKTFVGRIERVLHVGHVANDAIGAPDLHPRVVLPSAAAGSQKPQPAERRDVQEAARHSTKNGHQSVLS